MISYLKGTLAVKTPTYVLVETKGGVAYKVNISLNTFSAIEKEVEVKILTHLHIKEDSHTLFGFAEESERSIFLHLISVSGIGPATAQIMLSSMTPDEITKAVVGEDVKTINKVKGIGTKTAQRIILDLKDKLIKDSGENFISPDQMNNTIMNEALSALLALGFQKNSAQKAIDGVIKGDPTVDSVEVLIKRALKLMS